MTELKRINAQAQALKDETECFAKRQDGIYYAIAFIISFIALVLALLALVK